MRVRCWPLHSVHALHFSDISLNWKQKLSGSDSVGFVFRNCGATVSSTGPLQHTSARCITWNIERSYLDIGEEHFEHVGGRVAGVKEHQLGLLQVVGRQTLLNLMRRVLRKQLWVQFDCLIAPFSPTLVSSMIAHLLKSLFHDLRLI